MEFKDNSKNKDYWNANPMTYKPFDRDFLFPEDNSERILDSDGIIQSQSLSKKIGEIVNENTTIYTSLHLFSSYILSFGIR